MFEPCYVVGRLPSEMGLVWATNNLTICTLVVVFMAMTRNLNRAQVSFWDFIIARAFVPLRAAVAKKAGVGSCDAVFVLVAVY